MKKIYLAGGCFWGVEHYLSLIEGIKETTVGYANSDIPDPAYEDLKAHRSSASETVETVYDETVISLKEYLLPKSDCRNPTPLVLERARRSPAISRRCFSKLFLMQTFPKLSMA